MCKELEDELTEGRKIAESLVSHVERMGAGSVNIPIHGSDRLKWEVSVKRVK